MLKSSEKYWVLRFHELTEKYTLEKSCETNKNMAARKTSKSEKAQEESEKSQDVNHDNC